MVPTLPFRQHRQQHSFLRERQRYRALEAVQGVTTLDSTAALYSSAVSERSTPKGEQHAIRHERLSDSSVCSARPHLT